MRTLIIRYWIGDTSSLSFIRFCESMRSGPWLRTWAISLYPRASLPHFPSFLLTIPPFPLVFIVLLVSLVTMCLPSPVRPIKTASLAGVPKALLASGLRDNSFFLLCHVFIIKNLAASGSVLFRCFLLDNPHCPCRSLVGVSLKFPGPIWIYAGKLLVWCLAWPGW